MEIVIDTRLDFRDADLVLVQCSRSDILFFKNNGKRILSTLSQSLQACNSDRRTVQVINQFNMQINRPHEY